MKLTIEQKLDMVKEHVYKNSSISHIHEKYVIRINEKETRTFRVSEIKKFYKKINPE